MSHEIHNISNKGGINQMQTPTRRRTNGGRWARCLGIGAMTAATAAIIVAAAAPADAATANAPSGATGSIAALNASSMEVQNPSSGQTTVTWTSTTQFSKTVSEAVASVAVGDCVTATGTKSKSSKTTVAARSLTVTTPSSTGTCIGGGTRFGGTAGTGGTGGPPSGFGGRGFAFRGGEEGGTRPSFPSGSGANNFRKAFANLDIASGKVTAVKGSTLTVSGITLSGGSFGRPGQSNSKSKAKKPTTPKTQTLTVTTSGSTTVSATQSAAATDLAVGDCVSAFGPAATNGSVTATTVRITSTSGGGCTGRFAGPGGGGGFFGGPGGGGA
jgi:Domain of unknown function (DUF5666)